MRISSPKFIQNFYKPVLPGMALLFFLVSCAAETTTPADGDDGNDTTTGNRLIVDLPDSVSQSSSSGQIQVAARAEASNSGLEYLGVVREYAGLAEEIAGHIETMFHDNQENVNEFLAESGGAFTTAVVDVTDDGQALRIRIDAGQPHRIDIWQRDTGQKLYEASWSGDLLAENPAASGQAIIHGAMLDSGDSRVALEFNTSDDGWGHFMRVRMTGFSAGAGEAIDNMELFAARQGQEVVLSANAYLPDLENTEDENIFINNKRNYIFTAAADVDSDMAVVNVAMPLSSDTSTFEDLFTDSSVGDVYSLAVYDWLNEAAQSTLKGQLETATGITVDSVYDLQNALADAQFDGNSEIAELRFAFALENPMYTDSQGYVANGTSTRSGYEGLIPKVNQTGDELKTAAQVMNLSVTFGDPDMPAEADFSE